MNTTPYARSMPEPHISILVAADDHSPDPGKFIAALFSQTAAPGLFEVIFIDSKNHERFRQILTQFQSRHPEGSHFHYEVLPGIHRARAHNHAIQIARGKLLVFLGDDFIAPPAFVSSHLELHQHETAEEVVGIGSSLLAGRNSKGFYRQLEESGLLFGAAFSATMQTVPTNFFYVGNASIKKSFIKKHGSFDEDFPFDCWDDYEMGLRLARQGMRSIYVPEAMAEHDHAITFAERCRAIRRLGYSAALHEYKYPISKPPWQKRLKRSPTGWKIRAWRYRIQYWITGNPKYLARHLTARFDSHFVLGYRLARMGAKPDNAAFHHF